MEAAASVAGLLGLAGLAIQGVTSLRTFFGNFKDSNENVISLLEDLEALQQVLEHLSIFQHQKSSASSSLITSLRETILNCNRDLETWVREAEQFRVDGGRTLKKFKNKVKGAVDHEKLTTIRTKVSSYRKRLVLLLELLGREYDVQHRDDLRAIETMQKSNHVELTSNLNTLQTGMDRLHLTAASLTEMDSRIDLMQRMLVKSLSNGRDKLHRAKTAKKHDRRKSPRFSTPSTTSKAGPLSVVDRSETCLMRVIKTAILVQEADGKPMFELLATADRDYDTASNVVKLNMIRQLQGIRLIAWLLQSDNLLTASRFAGGRAGCTTLGSDCSLPYSYRANVIRQGMLEMKGIHELCGSTLERDVFGALQNSHVQLMSADKPANPFYPALKRFCDARTVRDVYKPGPMSLAMGLMSADQPQSQTVAMMSQRITMVSAILIALVELCVLEREDTCDSSRLYDVERDVIESEIVKRLVAKADGTSSIRSIFLHSILS